MLNGRPSTDRSDALVEKTSCLIFFGRNDAKSRGENPDLQLPGQRRGSTSVADKWKAAAAGKQADEVRRVPVVRLPYLIVSLKPEKEEPVKAATLAPPAAAVVPIVRKESISKSSPAPSASPVKAATPAASPAPSHSDSVASSGSKPHIHVSQYCYVLFAMLICRSPHSFSIVVLVLCRAHRFSSKLPVAVRKVALPMPCASLRSN